MSFQFIYDLNFKIISPSVHFMRVIWKYKTIQSLSWGFKLRWTYWASSIACIAFLSSFSSLSLWPGRSCKQTDGNLKCYFHPQILISKQQQTDKVCCCFWSIGKFPPTAANKQTNIFELWWFHFNSTQPLSIFLYFAQIV